MFVMFHGIDTRGVICSSKEKYFSARVRTGGGYRVLTHKESH